MASSSRRPPPAPQLEPLLSPTHLLPTQSTCDVYSLRHLILQRGGLPDSPTWLRPQAWSVLLRVLGNEKRDWPHEAEKRREEYYSLLEDVLPDSGSSSEPTHPYDALILQIHRDLIRSRYNAFSFFQSDVPASSVCPLAPSPSDGDEAAQSTSRKRSRKRHAVLDRLDAIHGRPSDPFHDYVRDNSQTQDQPPPSIHLSPPTPAKPSRSPDQQPATSRDMRSHCLLRILFLYALLNPTIGYIQGMVEVASVLLWTMGSATGLPSSEGSDAHNPHFEADTFWAFSLLLGELKDLWDFEGLDHGRAGLQVQNPRGTVGTTKRAAEVGGMARALQRLGGRLKWADEELWRALYVQGLSPSMPYYAFRWLATLLSTSLPLPSLLRIWDALLCETDTAHENHSSASGSTTPKIEFLIDILTALLISHRGALLERLEAVAATDQEDDNEQEAFGTCLAFLQELPDDDVGPALELATMLRQKRVAATLTGEGGPPDDEMEGEVAATMTSNIRTRALGALRGWRAANGSEPATTPTSAHSASTTSTSSSSTSGWFRSMSTSSMPAPPSPSTPTRSRRSPVEALGEGPQSPSSPSSSSGGGSIFSKYAQALQSSDAAAELSKRGTNWTARAMDRWNATGGAPANGTGSAMPSRRSASEAFAPTTAPSPLSNFSSRFGSMGATFRRNFSASGAPAADAAATPTDHPALQYSREQLPDFPLPDVMDSPDGRQEYAYFRPQSLIASSPRGAAGNIMRSPSPSPLGLSARNGMPDEWRFPTAGTPMRQDGRSNTNTSTSSSSTTNGTGARGAGPKPLLLAGSARAAREDDPNSSIHSTPPASKVVRTGPLAGGGSGSSPYNAQRASGTSNGGARRLGGGSRPGTASSVRRTSLADSSYSNSVAGDDHVLQQRYSQTSSARSGDGVGTGTGTASSSRRSSTSGPRDPDFDVSIGGDSIIEHWSDEEREEREWQGDQDGDGQPTSAVMTTSTSLQEALRTAGAVPKLPSLQKNQHTQRPSQHSHQHSFQHTGPITTSTKHSGGGGTTTSQGTIAAGAFGGGQRLSGQAAETPRSPQVDLSAETMVPDALTAPSRPVFGTISSSSDVPLVSNEGRQVRRRGGPSIQKRKSSGGNSLHTVSAAAAMSPVIPEDEGGFKRTSRDTLRLSGASASASASSNGSVGVGSAMDQPSASASGGVLEHPRKAPEPPVDDVQRYELTDGPVVPAAEKYQLSDEPVISAAEKYELSDGPVMPDRYQLNDGPVTATDKYQLSDEPMSYIAEERVATAPPRAPATTSAQRTTLTDNDHQAPPLMSPTTATRMKQRPSSTSSSLSSSSRKAKVRSKRSFKNAIDSSSTTAVPSPPLPLLSPRELSHDDVPTSARDDFFPRDEEQDSYDAGGGGGYFDGDRDDGGDMMQAISSAFEKFGRDGEGEDDTPRPAVVGAGLVRDHAGGIKF